MSSTSPYVSYQNLNGNTGAGGGDGVDHIPHAPGHGHDRVNNQNSVVLMDRRVKKYFMDVRNENGEIVSQQTYDACFFYHETRKYVFQKPASLNLNNEKELKEFYQAVSDFILAGMMDHRVRLLNSALTVPVFADGAILLILGILTLADVLKQTQLHATIPTLCLLVTEAAIDAIYHLNIFIFLYRSSFWVHAIYLLIYYVAFAILSQPIEVWCLLGARTLLELIELIAELNTDYRIHNALCDIENTITYGPNDTAIPYLGSSYIFYGFSLFTRVFCCLGSHQRNNKQLIKESCLCAVYIDVCQGVDERCCSSACPEHALGRETPYTGFCTLCDREPNTPQRGAGPPLLTIPSNDPVRSSASGP